MLKEVTVLTFNFTEEQLAIIDRALQEMPFKMVAPLYVEINKQVAAQQKPTVIETVPAE